MLNFKKALKLILSNSNTPIGFFQSKWTKGTSKTIGSYMYKYLTKEHREKCVRYVNYSRNFLRCCSSQFMFVHGRAGAWRAACRVLDEMFPDTFKFFYRNADFNYLLSVVNGCQGDIKSFLKGLQDMYLYFEKLDYFSLRYKFKMQFFSYVNDCLKSYKKIYPVGQLKFNF